MFLVGETETRGSIGGLPCLKAFGTMAPFLKEKYVMIKKYNCMVLFNFFYNIVFLGEINLPI